MQLHPTMGPRPKLLGLLLILQFGDLQGAFVEIDLKLAKLGAKFGQTSIYKDNDSFGPDKAFLTGNTTTYYHSQPGVPQALWVSFATPVPVVEFSFQSRPSGGLTGPDGPSKYVFFGSNAADCSDMSNWQTLFEDDPGKKFTRDNIAKTGQVPGNKSFKCYGFHVTEVGGGRGDGSKYVTMDNIKLYTTEQPRTAAATTEETTTQPKRTYPYPYVCEGEKLNESEKLIIKCDLGYIIKVNSRSENGQRVVNDGCTNQTSCTVPVSSPNSGELCEGTYNNIKSPEVDYTCERPVIESAADYTSTYKFESEDEQNLFHIQNVNRTVIIEENLNVIKKHNQHYIDGTTTYKQAPNRYSLLTYLEVLNKITGANVKDTSDIHPRYEPINLGNEPPSHNWIVEGAVNPIRDQGYCNSCWGFSTISVIESQIQIKTKVLQKLSEQYLIDCDKGAHNHGCEGGWPSFAINHVIKHGIALASEYNYTHANGTCNTAAPKTNYNVTKSEELIKPGNDVHLKNANFNKGPISVCIYAPPSFEHYSEGIYVDDKCESDNKVNHCVALVGYGTEKYPNGSEHKYWLLRNSWGTSWGENGYMRMSRKISNYCQISSHGVVPVYTEDLHKVIFSLDVGLAKATDTYAHFAPSKAFGGSALPQESRDDRFWHSRRALIGTKSLWYEFHKPIRVMKFSFRSRRWGGHLISEDGPSKYSFWASNSDDCSGENQRKKLHEDNPGRPFYENNTAKVESVKNNEVYRCYGFTITDVPGRINGDKWVTISQVQFYSITEVNVTLGETDPGARYDSNSVCVAQGSGASCNIQFTQPGN